MKQRISVPLDERLCALTDANRGYARRLRATLRMSTTRAAIVGNRLVRALGPTLRATVRHGNACLEYAGRGARASWRWWVALHVTRAVYLGTTSAQLDRAAAKYRTGTWAVVGLALLVWATIGWKAAALPALLSLVLGGTAIALWHAATELERRERSFWP